MENKFTPEFIEEAKSAKSAEELIALAKENGIEFDEETAKTYFNQLNPKTGELADDELDNVAGGACQSNSEHLDTQRVFKEKEQLLSLNTHLKIYYNRSFL